MGESSSPGSGRDRAGRRLGVAARHARAVLDQALADQGATFAGYLVLAELADRGPLTRPELGAALDVEPPTLTRELDLLERDGFVRQEPGDSRRSLRLCLTAAGDELLDGLDQAVVAADDEMQASLHPGERGKLERLLDRLIGPQ